MATIDVFRSPHAERLSNAVYSIPLNTLIGGDFAQTIPEGVRAVMFQTAAANIMMLDLMPEATRSSLPEVMTTNDEVMTAMVGSAIGRLGQSYLSGRTVEGIMPLNGCGDDLIRLTHRINQICSVSDPSDPWAQFLTTTAENFILAARDETGEYVLSRTPDQSETVDTIVFEDIFHTAETVRNIKRGHFASKAIDVLVPISRYSSPKGQGINLLSLYQVPDLEWYLSGAGMNKGLYDDISGAQISGADETNRHTAAELSSLERRNNHFLYLKKGTQIDLTTYRNVLRYTISQQLAEIVESYPGVGSIDVLGYIYQMLELKKGNPDQQFELANRLHQALLKPKLAA